MRALLARGQGRIGDHRVGRLTLRDGDAEHGDGGHTGGNACDSCEETHEERSWKIGLFGKRQHVLPAG
jgi:hypothetical protein